MRAAALLVANVASMAFAGSGLLGTKSGGAVAAAPTAPAGSGLPPLVSTLLAIGIVLFLLKVALPRLARFGAGSKDAGTIRIEASAPLSGGHLHIVSVRGRTLLVGASTTGFRTLADLSPPASEPEPPLFMDLVESVAPFQPTLPADAAERLRRLDLLAPEKS